MCDNDMVTDWTAAILSCSRSLFPDTKMVYILEMVSTFGTSIYSWSRRGVLCGCGRGHLLDVMVQGRGGGGGGASKEKGES